MPPRLAIIIPVYRESQAIEPCLHHLSQCPGIELCEVIVVDGDEGSTRTPLDLIPLRVTVSPSGRGTQLNAGARLATAPAMLFLHVDTVLPEEFVGRVLGALERFPAGAFDLHIVTRNLITKLISVVGRLRSRLTRIPYGDQAQFIRKSVFDEIGGFPDEPIMEDVALMDRIRTAGHRITFLTPPARTSDRRWRADGAARGTVRNWRLMAAYRSGVSPVELVKHYRPQSEAGRPMPGAGRVIVFYRALRPGSVKTRLAANLGDEAALAMYEGMVMDLRSALGGAAELLVPYIDDIDAGEDLLGGGLPQLGAALEERMDSAFRDTFAAGAQRVVLIGSDIPGLGSMRVREALAALEAHDAVIGPSVGGGYYLIGFRREEYQPIFMHDQPGDAYQLTVRAMTSSGITWAELPAMRDIDTERDLAALYRNPQGPHPNLDAAVALHAPHLLPPGDNVVEGDSP
jgi:rSAM/selenodomain-associated transferase 2